MYIALTDLGFLFFSQDIASNVLGIPGARAAKFSDRDATVADFLASLEAGLVIKSVFEVQQIVVEVEDSGRD